MHIFSCPTWPYFKRKGSCGHCGDALSRASFKVYMLYKSTFKGKLQLTAPLVVASVAENFLVHGHPLTSGPYHLMMEGLYKCQIISAHPV